MIISKMPNCKILSYFLNNGYNVSEEVKNETGATKGILWICYQMFQHILKKKWKTANADICWFWVRQSSCLLYSFLCFSIALLNIKLLYLLISHTFAIVLLHGLPPPLKIFPGRSLLFAPWISAFHLGVINEITRIHYLKPITYLPFISLPETLAL